MWSLRVYTYKKRAGQRLNLTPTPDQGPSVKTETRPGLKGKGKEHGLPKIAETERSRQRASGPGLPSTQLRITGERSLQENRTQVETQNEKMAPLSDSVTEDLQVDSSSSSSELVSGLSLPCDVSNSLLSYSTTESYTEPKSTEEELGSFSSPEQFRGSYYLDWEYPKLKEHKQCKNSTLLDTSKAVTIEKMPQFSDFSAILSTSSENYQKCNRKKSAPESSGGRSVTRVQLSKPMEPILKTNSSTPDKKNRGLLTSTPSSERTDFVIDLSSVQKAPFEELFPNISSYVNSNEIIPVSSLQENSSNEISPNTSEICCIIRASPGTRQMKNKAVTVKKKHSPPKDITQDIIIKTNGRI
ncbi:meiosis-specific kinetochore protein [Sciurus carolinensis]|uniref:meiosis-specific kinetochore protein n=1 Tax=Sciurus carolinensis TaxID=30640 RepID=UPI001FB2E786|nr:meiosis-specific kinetochore protein [Sciurus carolinensis]